MSMCTFNKYAEISEFVGKLHAGLLFVPNSTSVNKIARMLCEKQCYFNPNECFFDDEHTFDYRDLMKKEVHEKLNPNFLNILNKQSENDVILRYNDQNWPEISDPIEEIGFTTELVYNEKGYLDLNYDLFCRQMWDHYNQSPLYILEEKKVLDVILALLMAASEIHESERDNIENMYKQNAPGVNKPVLGLMAHGPGIHEYSNTMSEYCADTLVT